MDGSLLAPNHPSGWSSAASLASKSTLIPAVRSVHLHTSLRTDRPNDGAAHVRVFTVRNRNENNSKSEHKSSDSDHSNTELKERCSHPSFTSKNSNNDPKGRCVMHPPYTCQVAFEFGAQEPEWQASYPVPKCKKQMLTSAAALKNKISETKSDLQGRSLYPPESGSFLVKPLKTYFKIQILRFEFFALLQTVINNTAVVSTPPAHVVANTALRHEFSSPDRVNSKEKLTVANNVNEHGRWSFSSRLGECIDGILLDTGNLSDCGSRCNSVNVCTGQGKQSRRRYPNAIYCMEATKCANVQHGRWAPEEFVPPPFVHWHRIPGFQSLSKFWQLWQLPWPGHQKTEDQWYSKLQWGEWYPIQGWKETQAQSPIQVRNLAKKSGGRKGTHISRNVATDERQALCGGSEEIPQLRPSGRRNGSKKLASAHSCRKRECVQASCQRTFWSRSPPIQHHVSAGVVSPLDRFGPRKGQLWRRDPPHPGGGHGRRQSPLRCFCPPHGVRSTRQLNYGKGTVPLRRHSLCPGQQEKRSTTERLRYIRDPSLPTKRPRKTKGIHSRSEAASRPGSIFRQNHLGSAIWDPTNGPRPSANLQAEEDDDTRGAPGSGNCSPWNQQNSSGKNPISCHDKDLLGGPMVYVALQKPIQQNNLLVTGNEPNIKFNFLSHSPRTIIKAEGRLARSRPLPYCHLGTRPTNPPTYSIFNYFLDYG